MARRTKAEIAAAEADEAAQEKGSSKVTVPRIATDYVHAKHPDTGLDVVFVRGEALPDWVLAASDADETEIQ